jgi:hypothetical protein
MPMPVKSSLKDVIRLLVLKFITYALLGAAVMVGMKAIDWLIPRPPLVVEVRAHG